MRETYWKQHEFHWGVLLLCAYHFFPFITTKGSILLYAWAYAIPFIYLALNLKYVKQILNIMVYSEALSSLTCIALLVIFSLMIPVVYRTYDFTYFSGAIMTMLKIFIRMLFLTTVIIKHIPCATKETFMKYFIFSCCLYVCGTIVMLIVPEIKTIFYELVKEDAYSKQLALETRYSTRYGWAGFSGFEHTYKCVLAIIFNDYLLNKSIKGKRRWYMIGVSTLLMLGTLFYGRIGLLVGLVVFLFMIFRLLCKRPKIFMVLIAGIVVAFFALLIMQNQNAQVRAWFVWAFDLFINFFKTGKLETYSSNVLFEKMLFVPSVKTMVLGDGMYTSTTGSYYMSTDAGIMRPLLFGGVLFAGIRYLSVCGILLINIIKSKWDKYEKWMWLWILLSCLIFEVKGEIIFSCLPIVIWLVILKHYGKEKRK